MRCRPEEKRRRMDITASQERHLGLYQEHNAKATQIDILRISVKNAMVLPR